MKKRQQELMGHQCKLQMHLLRMKVHKTTLALCCFLNSKFNL